MAIKVKNLNWEGPFCGIWKAYKRFHNDAAMYKIIWDLGKEETYTVYAGNKRLGVVGNLKDAKAYADVHFTQSILQWVEGT